MKKVLISAGHSDVDPGAVNNELKITEAQKAVEARDAIAAALRGKGVEVIEDGLDGKNQPLPEAIKLCRQAGLAVEIHFNAGPVSASGIEAISLPDKRPFAQALAVAVAGATKSKLRGAGGWIDQSQSQHSRLGFVEDGGVILELEFISNKGAMLNYMANSANVYEAVAATIAAYAKG